MPVRKPKNVDAAIAKFVNKWTRRLDKDAKGLGFDRKQFLSKVADGLDQFAKWRRAEEKRTLRFFNDLTKKKTKVGAKRRSRA